MIKSLPQFGAAYLLTAENTKQFLDAKGVDAQAQMLHQLTGDDNFIDQANQPFDVNDADSFSAQNKFKAGLVVNVVGDECLFAVTNKEGKHLDQFNAIQQEINGGVKPESESSLSSVLIDLDKRISANAGDPNRKTSAALIAYLCNQDIQNV